MALPDESTTPTHPPRRMLIVIGTYHSVMVGLLLRHNRLGVLFSTKHHTSSVGAVAVGPRYMASTGPDERLFLFTNKHHAEHRATSQRRLHAAGASCGVRLSLLGHLSPPSEVCALRLSADSQHMLCGGTDGRLVVYRTRDWSTAAALPIHAKRIVDLALHPNGAALALTAAADRYVAVVDLVKGKLLAKWRFQTPKPPQTDGEAQTAEAVPCGRETRREEPRVVRFSQSGRYFAVGGSHLLIIYETATMTPLAHYRAAAPIQPDEELHTFAFLRDDALLVGEESGQLRLCCGPWGSGEEPRVLGAMRAMPLDTTDGDASDKRHPIAHSGRVKALHVVGDVVCAADATGAVIVWRLERGGEGLKYVCSANCKGRITAMDVLPL